MPEPVLKKRKSIMEELLGDMYVSHLEPDISPLEQAKKEVERYRKVSTVHVDTVSQVL